MKIATRDEISEFFGDSFFQCWTDGTWRRLARGFRTGGDCGGLNALARTLAQAMNERGGSVLLIEETGIFPSCEDLYLAKALRTLAGETRPIHDAPGYLFDQTEMQPCWSVIHVCLINFWDFLLVSNDKQTCLRGSHDEYVELFALGRSEFDRIIAALRALKFAEFDPNKPGS